MSKIVVEVFPASFGDCFLIRLENDDSGSINILVDGGFNKAPYQLILKEHFKILHGKGNVIDLMIVTHIDADHINGVVAFLNDNEKDQIIPVKEIWFNGLRHIHQWENAVEQLTADQRNYLLSFIRQGRPEIENENGELGDISAKSGISLTKLILERKINWNGSFSGNAILKGNPIQNRLFEKFKITILTPTPEILTELNKKWRNELGNNFNTIKDTLLEQVVEFILAQIQEDVISQMTEISNVSQPFEDLCRVSFIEDTAIVNRSSISFVLEYEGGKLLFLGDAHPSDVLSALKELYPNETEMFFDVVKIAHHGSEGNTSPELLNFIDANHFIISTNGEKFNHPSLTTLARIVCRPLVNSDVRNLIFNYDTTCAYQSMNNADWQSQYNYTIQTITKPFITIEI